jgi:CxxC motif-containing protein (DUF1111 family)
MNVVMARDRTTTYLALLCLLSLIFGGVSVTAVGQSEHQAQTRDNVFGDPIRGLSREEQEEFEKGYKLFIKVWPRSKGQLSNGDTCIACHLEPMPGGSGTSDRTVVVLSREALDLTGGHVFQRFRERPDESIETRSLPKVASRRKTPPLFGLGLLEAARRLDSDTTNQGERKGGLFGWRADVQSLDAFVERALAVELGLATPHYATSTKSKASPDVSVEEIRLIAQFIRFLGPPRTKRADFMDHPGAQLFGRIGCTACHNPTLTSLRGKVIHPYSDLRRHDMGTRLADCQDEQVSNCSSFRTTPLWGISSTGPPFLHDGSASSLEEAITAHGGEAQVSVDKYRALNFKDRALVLDFLNSL